MKFTIEVRATLSAVEQAHERVSELINFQHDIIDPELGLEMEVERTASNSWEFNFDLITEEERQAVLDFFENEIVDTFPEETLFFHQV